MGNDLTVKQIIEEINIMLQANAEKQIIKNKGFNAGYDTENGRKFIDIYDIKRLFNEYSKRLSLIDLRGTYVFSSDNGYNNPENASFCIKAKRQKQEAKSDWDHKPHWNIIKIELLTENLENMTLDEVCDFINGKENEKDNQEAERRRNIYNEVKAELNRLGISVREIHTLEKKISDVGYMWDKFEKEIM